MNNSNLLSCLESKIEYFFKNKYNIEFKPKIRWNKGQALHYGHCNFSLHSIKKFNLNETELLEELFKFLNTK